MSSVEKLIDSHYERFSGLGSKHVLRIPNRLVVHILLLMLLAFVNFSCSNDIEKVQFFDRKDLPSQMVTKAHVIRSDSGKKQLVLEAPCIEAYEKPERKTVYPKGLQIHFYDNTNALKAYIRAGYGISLDDRELMEIRHNVVIIDYRTGDTSYLENLVWNSGEGRIYSNNPVRSVNGQRVTLGDGFESDDNFETPQIIHQRGTVLINE